MAIRLDVQQQNSATRDQIARAAQTFRNDMLSSYPWLLNELLSRSLDPLTGILAKLERIPEQEGELFEGYWLSEDKRFFRFEVMVSRSQAVTANVELWQDASESVLVSAHQPGTGKSFGWLALDVLRELNEDQG